MGIPRCRGRMFVAKKRADDRQAQSTGRDDAGEAVSQIMEPEIGEVGGLPNSRPSLVDSRAGAFGSNAGDDPRIILQPGQSLEQSASRRIQVNDLGAGLAIGEAQAVMLEIDIVPAQI